jgi:hypothetical protein
MVAWEGQSCFQSQRGRNLSVGVNLLTRFPWSRRASRNRMGTSASMVPMRLAAAARAEASSRLPADNVANICSLALLHGASDVFWNPLGFFQDQPGFGAKAASVLPEHSEGLS